MIEEVTYIIYSNMRIPTDDKVAIRYYKKKKFLSGGTVEEPKM